MWTVHSRSIPYAPPPPFDTRFNPDYEGEVYGAVSGLKAVRPSDADLEQFIALYDGEIAQVDERIVFQQCCSRYDYLRWGADTPYALDHPH